MIDAHHHFWQYDPVNYSWIDDSMASIRKSYYPEDLAPILKENGFEGSVLIQVNQEESENEEFLNYAQNNAFILGTVGWVDLKDPNLEERLAFYKESPKAQKLKGFRHIVQAEAEGFLLDESFVSGVQKLADFDFTYDILIKEHQLKETLHFIRKLPNNKLIIDHIAKPDIKVRSIRQWSNYMQAIAAHENVYIKVSGMVTEHDFTNWKKEDFFPYLDEVLGTFGPSRIVYGSDWPVCLVAGAYEAQLDIVKSYFSRLSQAEQQAIFGENARQFYSL
ncbi:amidohydrolase family protein [Marinilongibacter aquaticus]|uniref:amidohydrolase family protein n=1 Tax=Marinilongibacter aquaticus TaxID=2975157 RepID=UPI0021BD77DB|nr:amidohydrolase family protein [Marinilongibacter aquaticus]UBM60275.1 amidohydrolase family protein [Marinilongibacter aquaticus]